MVSKIVALTLLAALTSPINAYFWQVEVTYQGTPPTTLDIKVNPVDPMVPGNEALVRETQSQVIGRTSVLSFDKYGYENVLLNFRTHSVESPFLGGMIAINSTGGDGVNFGCNKVDEFLSTRPTDLNRKLYFCRHTDYYDRKGIPMNTPTTTTALPVTTCPVVTVTVPVTVTTTTPPRPTTTPPKPSPTCLAGYIGKRNGKGPDGACCSDHDDCKEICVVGICGTNCLAGYRGKRNGKGPNGACCSNSYDCIDTCVDGVCGVHP